MRDYFNQQLEHLNQELTQMGNMIQKSIKATVAAFVSLDVETAKEIIEAFLEHDLEKAYRVIKHDDVVDDLFDRVRGEIVDMIQEDAGNGTAATDLLMTAKYLERIGDHACNISEWVIFSITGTHVSEE